MLSYQTKEYWPAQISLFLRRFREAVGTEYEVSSSGSGDGRQYVLCMDLEGNESDICAEIEDKLRRTIKNRYFKKETPIMLSGLPLPVDEDGVVRDKVFSRCDFHPSCAEVAFENCIFEQCGGIHYLILRKTGCQTVSLSSCCG